MSGAGVTGTLTIGGRDYAVWKIEKGPGPDETTLHATTPDPDGNPYPAVLRFKINSVPAPQEQP